MTPNLRLVGQRIKEYMQVRGLTIAAVARMSKFSSKELNAMIEGTRYPVSQLMLLLSLFEDINPSWLLHGESPMLLKGMPKPLREFRADAEARAELRRLAIQNQAAAPQSKEELRQQIAELRETVEALNATVRDQAERLQRLEAR